MTTTNDGGPVHPMVMKAARAMAEHEGEKYGPSAWELYSHAYLAMAQAALTECGALECFQALESARGYVAQVVSVDGEEVSEIDNTIAKVYGIAPE